MGHTVIIYDNVRPPSDHEDQPQEPGYDQDDDDDDAVEEGSVAKGKPKNKWDHLSGKRKSYTWKQK